MEKLVNHALVKLVTKIAVTIGVGTLSVYVATANPELYATFCGVR